MTPLLKCVEEERIQTILSEAHEGACGQHQGANGRQRICRKVPEVPRAFEATKSAHDKAISQSSSLTLRQMGNRPSRTLLESSRPSKIPDSSNRLLHKVGGS
ncbi:hypothetical protein PIB30_097056 [Stylosanthes scabra]|uniref:Uncharacterized protein n=1 Tax=Stylosanthes scabra TaxID=79078 RepID=A0ABU6XTS4_9FABA|nr:hypothetical protein [Stylosanthes scabra]